MRAGMTIGGNAERSRETKSDGGVMVVALMAAACLTFLPLRADEAALTPSEAGEVSESATVTAGTTSAGELTAYKVKSSLDDITESGAKKAVYFNKQLYTVSRYSDFWWGYGRKGDMIGCMRYETTDSSGHLTNPTRMRWVAKSSETGDDKLSGQDVTACVYNGRIYVVYDYINPNNWSERLLYVKSSIDPEGLEWEPKGGARIEAAPAVNTGFGVGAPRLNVAAAVLGDKLYVFYTHSKGSGVFSVVFDGKSWSAGPSLQGAGFLSLDAQTVTADDGSELIAIAAVDNNNCRVMGFDGQTIRSAAKDINFYGKGMYCGYVRVAGGSVPAPGAQASRLQIFASGGYGVWRFEYSLPDKYGDSGTFSDGNMAGIGFSSMWGWCPATHFFYKGDTFKDLQQYLTLVGPVTIHVGRNSYTELRAATYLSDYFKHLQTNQINTAESGKLPSAWSIIGVIEGVPPFCLNGTRPEPQATSSVKYGQSVEKEIATSQTYNASFSVGIGGKGAAIGGGVEFTQGFKTVHDWSKTIKKELTINMENKDENEEGIYGYLIVSKPTLTVSNYERRASDQETTLGNVTFTFVADVSVESVPYRLETPAQDGFSGITAKPKSSDYKKWFCMPIPGNLVLEKMNSLSADIRGTKSESMISIKSAEKVSRNSSSKVKVEAAFFDIFKTSAAFTFSLDSVNSTSLSKNISASLSLPKGDSELTRIVTTPYWLVPDENSTAKPFWVPDDYLWNKPWCLTWSVISLDPAPTPSKALTMDFNKDGIQDLAAFHVAKSSAALRHDGENSTIGFLYNITQGTKKRTAEKITLQSSNTAMQLLCVGDLDANGCSDMLWIDTTRNALVAVLIQEDGTSVIKELQGIVVDDIIRPVEMGRFLAASGQAGILTRDSFTGDLKLYQLDPTTFEVANSYTVYSPGYSHWMYAGRGDFDGDNNWDFLVVNDETGEFNIIFLHADEGAGIVGRLATVQDELVIGKSVRALADLQYLGVCDFNGDGRSDMLFIENDKKLIVALMDAENVSKAGYVKGAALKTGQTIVTIGDTSQDGRADIILEQDSGNKRKLIIWSVGEPKNTSGQSPDACAVTATESLTLDQEFNEDLSIELFPSLD